LSDRLDDRSRYGVADKLRRLAMNDDEVDDDEFTEEDLAQEVLRQEALGAATTLASLATFISALFTIIGVLGILGGVVILADRARFGGDHVIAGASVIVGSILQIGLVVIFTTTAEVVARYVKFQTS
jgi:uncharacterized membrane protein YdbT with pleckstrin-like domain